MKEGRKEEEGEIHSQMAERNDNPPKFRMLSINYDFTSKHFSKNTWKFASFSFLVFNNMS